MSSNERAILLCMCKRERNRERVRGEREFHWVYPSVSGARRYKFHPILSLPPIRKKKKKLNFPYG
jgi:hypothetical protein